LRAPFDVHGLGAVIYKEARHIMREPTTLGLILAMPLMQLLIYGYDINLHVEHVRTVYYSEDRGRVAGDFLAALEASQSFDIVGRAGSPQALRQAIVAGKAHVGFDIPATFSADVLRAKPSAVQVLIDGADSNTAQAAYAAAMQVGAAFGLRLHELAESPAVDIRPRMLFNPSLRTTNFLVPGLIGLVMQNSTIVLTALSIVNERLAGTLDQMRVTPIGSAAIVLGKLIPYAIVGFLDLLLVLFAMRGVFLIPIAGSVTLLLILGTGFLMTMLGIGLLISTIARSQMQAMLITAFFILPSVLLSGMFFDIDLEPAPMRAISYLLPTTYFLELLRAIIVRGATLGDLWVPATVTLAFGIGMLGIASVRFAATQ